MNHYGSYEGSSITVNISVSVSFSTSFFSIKVAQKKYASDKKKLLNLLHVYGSYEGNSNSGSQIFGSIIRLSRPQKPKKVDGCGSNFQTGPHETIL
jgi:hypothetical protein